MAPAAKSTPPWRRSESAIEDSEVRAKEVKRNNTSESRTPTPENYVYNCDNFPPALLRPETSATLESTKSLSDTRYDTCQDNPCLKYEGKEPK